MGSRKKNGENGMGSLRGSALATLITPLWGGWEFMPRPASRNEPASWQRLAQAHQWLLSPDLRRQLVRNEEAIVVTDSGQVIQWVNTRFEQLTGYTQAEAAGRRPDLVQGPETSLLTRQRIRQALQSQQVIREQLLNYRKDQTMYWCDITIYPIFNPQQQLVHYLAFEQEVSAG